MRYAGAVVLILAFFVGSAVCLAQTVPSAELIAQAKKFDGKTIIYSGEVIGDVMARGQYAWINVNDGSNAVGVWITAAMASEIGQAGDFRHIGDTVEVSGVFNRVCVQHGGDLDIHAQTLRIVAPRGAEGMQHDKNKKRLGDKIIGSDGGNMDIESIKNAVTQDLAAVKSIADLEALRVKYLGRKGALAELTSAIPKVTPEQRGAFGRQVNELKGAVAALFDEKQKSLASVSAAPSGDRPDMGMPGIVQDIGRLHVLTQTINEICDIFVRMGFLIVDGLEVETEYNNFTGLNIPLEHPSREAFDTFYLKDLDATALGRPASDGKLLLRSQTSSVQISVMKANKPPLAVVAPGRVYRPDAVDASHSFMFHQIEGFMVDKGVKFSDLKGTLEFFAKAVFGQDIKMRFRPHFFPFTEPSAEIDISCIICKGKGCSVCGKKGWLEILGSGMIHPNVFRNVGYDPKKYTGFAFGMGVERIAMLKYGITDIRLFYENDLRFLRQF